MPNITCVVVGDDNVGKTSLLKRCTTDTFLNIPNGKTIYDIYSASVNVDGTAVNLTILDIACTEDYDSWRPQHYKDADVVILCFSIADPQSLESISTKWHPEIIQNCPAAPIVVVGTRLDLRNDASIIEALKLRDSSPVDYEEAAHVSEAIGAAEYLECSAKKRENTQEILDKIAAIALDQSSQSPTTCTCINI